MPDALLVTLMAVFMILAPASSGAANICDRQNVLNNRLGVTFWLASLVGFAGVIAFGIVGQNQFHGETAMIYIAFGLFFTFCSVLLFPDRMINR